MTGITREAGPGAGMAAMVIAMLCLPLVDAIAKVLTESYSPGQIGLARFGFQTLFLAGVIVVRRIAPGRPRLGHVLAGMTIALSVLLFVWSLRVLPVATAVAIFFLSPLLLLLLSHVFLKERLDRQRLAAVLVGFGGALLVIRPNWEVFGWVAVLPLASATCYALYVVLTKALVAGQSRVALQFWIGGVASLVFLLGTVLGSLGGEPLLSLAAPDREGWLLFAAMGAAWAIIHLMIATALTLARASILAPLQYLEIIGAALWGYLVFGVLPDSTTWLGTAIIVATGLYAIYRERKPVRG